MPKKGRKRLTQPKGTTAKGQKSTRPRASQKSVSSTQTTSTPADTDHVAETSQNNAVSAIRSATSSDITIAPSLEVNVSDSSILKSPPPKRTKSSRVRILSDITIVPHLEVDVADDGSLMPPPPKRVKTSTGVSSSSGGRALPAAKTHIAISNDDDDNVSVLQIEPPVHTEKGKKRVSFYNGLPKEEEYRPYAPLKRYNMVQHAVQLIVHDMNNLSQTLNELSMETERPIIERMIQFLPSAIDEQLADVYVPEYAEQTDGTDDSVPPALGAVIPRPPEQVEVVQDIDAIMVDVENEVRQVEQDRVQEALLTEREALIALQRAVNENIDAGNTYLMATERHLRDGPSFLGPLTRMCAFCSALHFRSEITTRRVYSRCCQEGKVTLPALRRMPDLLRHLFGRDGGHQHSANFRRLILKYNYAFQFVSLEANRREFPPGRAPPIYCIQGKMYHHLSNVDVNDPVQRFGPIYFLTPQVAIDHRHRNTATLDLGVIAAIEDLMRIVNPYAQAYMHLRNRYDLEVETIERLRADAPDLHVDPPLPMPTVTLELLSVRGANNRRFDLPVLDEVAAVYNANPDAPPTPTLKVYVLDRPTAFRTVSTENEIVDPLVFPLLFPHGELGWCWGTPHNAGQRNITLCEYYAYRLAIRDNEQRFLYGGKLTQQYIVAAYIKIEANRLKYIMQHQERLRAEQYVGLADYLHRRVNEDDDAATLGRMVLLPSTFIGSPRHQQQLFQDSMAVVCRYGVPSLFITMTTNPRWREIVENLPQGHQACDHPMLLARVFQCKLDELIADITELNCFGVAIANLYVIEFQKRGLPHAHILTILRNEDKLIDPQRIQMLIRAEIPDRRLEPELYDIVTTNMIHGPCGVINPTSPCMVNNKCSKNFPKPFCPETIIGGNGRTTYQRRDDGRTITRVIGDVVHTLHNGWIVPYNAYTLLKYNCHINVEACASVHAVKYLYKYFFKGADHALVRIGVAPQMEYNEVETYLNARYMSPPEASWHLNQFPTHKSTHTVYRLCVHLPERQVVRFQPSFEFEALRRNEITQLTGWFRLNENDAEARQHLYCDIPFHYVWQISQRRWNKRRRGADKIVTRMYSVSMRNQELYCLRLLLLHVRGPRSYEDVRTVEGVVCDTFKEACQRRNLLADDVEWVRALREATQRQMPPHLRNMFAYMLIFCEISDRIALWNQFCDDFIEDYTRAGTPRDEAIQRALRHIQTVLRLHGCRLTDFGLPEPNDLPDDFGEDDINVEAERLEGENLRNQLNEDQSRLYEAIIHSVHHDDDPNRLFLINAPAGTGKSFLFQTLISVLRGDDISVVAMAPTGLAASLLKGGRTLHSRFKIPLDVDETTTTRVTPRSVLGMQIAAAKLIIIDEISMVTRTIFNLVERGLRDICQNNQPFANRTVVIAGDFRQTLPVLLNGNRASIVDACIKGSKHFGSFAPHTLQVNVRAGPDEQAFSDWILQLGSATLHPLRRTFYGNIIRIPAECVVTTTDDLINFCFDSLLTDSVPNRAILTPLNSTCHDINQQVLDKLPGVAKTYYSADSVDVTDDPAAELANYTVEFLNTLNPSGMPLHKLTLKINRSTILACKRQRTDTKIFQQFFI